MGRKTQLQKLLGLRLREVEIPVGLGVGSVALHDEGREVPPPLRDFRADKRLLELQRVLEVCLERSQLGHLIFGYANSGSEGAVLVQIASVREARKKP